MVDTKVCVVTGANKGIGFETVKILAKRHPEWVIYLTSRDEGRGTTAVKELAMENIKYFKLDITDSSQIAALAQHLKAEHDGLDILINNAGVYLEDEKPVTPEMVEAVVATNYFGVINTCKALFPILKSGGRVVNVASRVANICWFKLSSSLKAEFNAATTVDEISALVNRAVESVRKETQVADGWGTQPWGLGYGSSKAGVVFATKLLALELPGEDQVVNAACPGYVATDMTNGGGLETLEEGTDTIIWLATLLAGTTQTGRFYASRTEFAMNSYGKLMWHWVPLAGRSMSRAVKNLFSFDKETVPPPQPAVDPDQPSSSTS